MVEELVRTSKLADTGSDHVVGLESHSPHLMKMNIHPRIDNLCNVEKHRVLVSHLHSRHSASQRILVSSLPHFQFPFLCFPHPFAFLFLYYQSENLESRPPVPDSKWWYLWWYGASHLAISIQVSIVVPDCLVKQRSCLYEPVIKKDALHSKCGYAGTCCSRHRRRLSRAC